LPPIADVPVALLAGGLAKRLGSATQNTPKALIDVAGRPFIDHQLDLLARNGVRRVVLCLCHLGPQVQDHVRDGSAFSLHVDYSFDGPEPLGTGGALRRAAHLLGDLFWVMYGDSYMDIDYPAVLRHFLPHDADALMTVLHNRNRWDRSNVLFGDGKLLRYDKAHPTPDMRHVDYGVALLRSPALRRIPADRPSDLADLYRTLVAEGRMIGYEVHTRFYEIGTPASLEETRAYLIARTARS
jgi:NDP-sugar pyrophosphorylase family protein